ncbi:MAG: hypothetical protein HY814_13955 [Candidatus Riflebacteria bacterium]|nr:hypothetical protein [Candidatus Riflebacteria bacterium]
MSVDENGTVTLSEERQRVAGTAAEPVFLLVEIDEAIDTLQRQIEENRQDLVVYEAELVETRREVETVSHAAKELARAASREEGEIAQKTEKGKQLEGRIFKIVSPKELAAVQGEIAALQTGIREAEERLLSFYEQQEAAAKRLADAEAKLQRLEPAVKKKSNEKRTASAKMALRITQLEDLRADHLAQLDPGLRARYLSARERNGGVAAHAIEENGCGSCGWVAGAIELRRLRQNRGKFFDCQNCGCLLVWFGAAEE